MQSKIYTAIIGLVFLTLGRGLLSLGHEFVMSQKPVDFGHWFMLLGAVLATCFIFIFPKNWLTRIAAYLTLFGMIAHVGMCSIDMVFWSFGEDHDSRNNLIGHLMGVPAIWTLFFVIGPACFFTGLSLYAWNVIKKSPLIALLAIVGSACIGIGQFAWQNQLFVLAGYIAFTLGMGALALKRHKETS